MKAYTKIPKNNSVLVKHILGETAEALVTRLEGSENMYRFNCDAYVVGENCKGGFFHLRQAREVIPGKRLGNNVRFWPRLRRALHEAGMKPVNIPGGEVPIHFFDELVIPDFKMSGSHYFVIKKSEVKKYLEKLPLDDAGKLHAEAIAKAKADAEAEAYRQAHDPQCIAKKIGLKLWDAGAYSISRDAEFVKVTLVDKAEVAVSVIYPQRQTDLSWNGAYNVAKVVCAEPEITGLEFLSGWTAGKLDPSKHSRIKKQEVSWNKVHAYLMPDPELATQVREHSRWLDLFDGAQNDGVPAKLIASAIRVIIETYDLNDNILSERYVYDSEADVATRA